MTNITPRSDERWEGGFVRDTTTGEITVKITQGNVSLSTTDIEVGKVKLLDAGGTNVGTISAAGALKVDGSAATQPVSGTVAVSNVSFPVTGPLTDTQLRATAVPVSGTITASGPLTDTQLRATAVPVSGTVTATGPLTDTQLRASAVPVSGTFFQATQPVSLATNTPDVTDRAARLLGVLSAGVNKIGTVDIATAPAVAKGTQGANGVPTQDLKDSGRAAITITGFQVAGIITTEALFAASLVRAADGVAAGAATQHTVTAGKRLRIQSIAVTVKNTAAAAGTSKLALRYRPGGGTVATTDSIIAILDIGSNNATAANYIGPYLMDLPDGFELVGSATFGFTNLSSAVTMLHTITVVGFEY